MGEALALADIKAVLDASAHSVDTPDFKSTRRLIILDINPLIFHLACAVTGHAAIIVKAAQCIGTPP